MNRPGDVNLRLIRIGPRFIDPVALALGVLFVPPLLVVLVTAGLVAQIWLLVMHGVGGSLEGAVTSPGLLLGALGMVAAGCAFHELGHAAALRYAGGRARGMGIGIYLVYPVFYTDVSESYRLGRWQRVRVDLGGFYFNLIFTFGLTAVYALTRWQVALLATVIIDIDVVRQLLPFVRLDGYWLLADLTGVPDFFSQMGSFVRGLAPGRRSETRRLPALRPAARLVFALYTVITVPLLMLLLVLMLRAVPQVPPALWTAFDRFVSHVETAIRHGEWLGALALGVQFVLLALPVAGMVIVLWSVAVRACAGIVRWSRPSWPRRLAGTAIGAAGIAGVAALWLPQLK